MSHTRLRARSAARLALPALALVLAAALTGCGGDDSSASGEESPGASGTPSTSSGDASSDAAQQTLEVTVEGDSISPNAEEIALAPGQTLAVSITSDRDGELHVHSSPEQYIEFSSGTTTKDLTFDTPGPIEIEEHESDTVVAQVEVQ